MNSCSILLVTLLAAATYTTVFAAKHACDPLAKDVKHFPLHTFAKMSEVSKYFVVRAQVIRDHDPQTEVFCTVASYDDGCGAVYYERRIKPISGEKVTHDMIDIETLAVGYHTASQTAFEFKMKMKMIDDDDYIFESNGEITGTLKLMDGKIDSSRTLPDKYKKNLEKQFALVDTDGEHYAVYVACDKSFAWATMSASVPVTEYGVYALKIEATLQSIEKIKLEGRDVDYKMNSLVPVAPVVPKHVHPQPQA